MGKSGVSRSDVLMRRLRQLCAEYGCVRICGVEPGDPPFVRVSPEFSVPGDAPISPYYLLMPGLYRLLLEEYGSLEGAHAFFVGRTS